MTIREPDIRTGSIIADKYVVERILGRGGMGMVVAARHTGLDELRAIKFMLPHVLRDATAAERFRREAQAASRLKSQHVVRVYDIDRLPTGSMYMVMEHLRGRDLKALAKARGVLPVREACTYVLQACEAVAEAHASGIVHRDLKTANLFLTTDPRGEPLINGPRFRRRQAHR
ncbi:serine/threonine protein kinase [Polyangium jinanense]|uniref:serine/threonine-protein kinase n=1 Tax=Polyangium jinanense TaxID=2829994 RepID=UPI0023409622|nr:serine/threonine-protein kinase [Polyangium jinanense]MDC3958535.1 serine/threonine protein kinase [Polyangium jinanense]